MASTETRLGGWVLRIVQLPSATSVTSTAGALNCLVNAVRALSFKETQSREFGRQSELRALLTAVTKCQETGKSWACGETVSSC